MVKVSVSGLDATAMYSVLLEFVQIEQHRYVGQQGLIFRVVTFDLAPTSWVAL